jgi:UDP-3-O-[3-hydroxymyristoyl] glucosamine N-acyltransferase
MAVTVSQLAKHLQAELIGNTEDFDRQIVSVSTVTGAGEKEVTFVSDKKHESAVSNSKAAAVIVGRCMEGLSKPQLVVKNVDAALIEALKLFAPKLTFPEPAIDPTVKLGKNVKVAEAVSIGAYVLIDDGVQIGKNSIIGAGCKIGENTKIGENCRLDSNVVIYHNCSLGNNVIIQANSTIGSTGFGYAFIDGAHRLVPHNGGVVIEDFVEIGADCCIDRAKFGNTIIGTGTKIDNLVQIAHNVVIGKCCLISAQVGIAGSCQIGDGVVMAGQVGLAHNIQVGARAMLGAQAGVMSNVQEGQKLAWSPAIDVKEAVRVVAHVLRLPKMAEQLKKLTKRIERLEASKDHKRCW